MLLAGPHRADLVRGKVSVVGGIVVRMFERCPGAVLVADLVSVQEAAPVVDAHAAAVDLLEQAVGWERVAAWVEFNRLDTLRRFAVARTEADRALGPDDVPQTPSALAALRRLQACVEEEAGRFAAEEIALALNVSPASAHKQLALARDLCGVHRDLGEALQAGEVSGFVASMVATTTRRLPEQARRVIDEAVTADAVELPALVDAVAARRRDRGGGRRGAGEPSHRGEQFFAAQLV